MKLMVGDIVLITAGKDKGQKAPIERVLAKEGRVIVTGMNVYKRARKGFAGNKGGITEFSRPLPVSNVALVCPSCGKPTRVAYRVDKSGEKVRICAKCKEAMTDQSKGSRAAG